MRDLSKIVQTSSATLWRLERGIGKPTPQVQLALTRGLLITPTQARALLSPAGKGGKPLKAGRPAPMATKGLLAWRTRMGLSLVELSRKTGVSVAQLWRIERKVKAPSLRIELLLMRNLGIGPRKLRLLLGSAGRRAGTAGKKRPVAALPARFLKWRLSRGLTLNALARRLDLPVTTIWRFERGVGPRKNELGNRLRKLMSR
ncbi:MAG: transcriptional regulator [Planctomycetes bacterium]|nr:transcriptional regulator [Planctomycetota bacterium]